MTTKTRVRDIMTQGKRLVTCGPSDKVADAIRLMVEHKVSGLPVVDENDMVEGVVTEADVLLARRTTNVKTVMTRDIVAIGADATPREAAELLTSRKVKRAVVLRSDGTVWGIMTSFQAIAVSKNTNLSVVAPGIAEALFATALGLMAAIPAVIFYNKFSADSSAISQRLYAFSDEFAAIVSRQIDVRN